MVAEAEFAEASLFLAPVLARESISKARGKSIIEKLAEDSHAHADPDISQRRAVIRRTITLLLGVHNVLCAVPTEIGSIDEPINPKQRKLVDGLLDLISLEGIYPTLAPGVGVPIERRVKSVLQGGLVTRTDPSRVSDHDEDESLLVEVVNSFREVATSGNGLCNALRGRTMVDLVAGTAQLAFIPSETGKQRNKEYGLVLEELLNKTPSSFLLPVLTSLLHPATPSWLRPHISTALSLLPVRPDGVRQTIYFVISTVSQSSHGQVIGEDESRPSISHQPLSLEELSQASKLLSSVPGTMTAETYFTSIAPQLLDLLDQEGTELQKAAAYIINTGILGRRKYGAPPQSIGWNLFAKPILEKVNPELDELSGDGKISRQVLVSESDYCQALTRLSALGSARAYSSSTNRLIAPLELPLWGLTCFLEGTETAGSDQPFRLLSAYLKAFAGAKGLIRLADHFLWTGPKWTYRRGPCGNVQICQRSENSGLNSDVVDLLHQINLRVKIFLRFSEPDIVSDDELSDVFLHVTKKWLFVGSGSDKESSIALGKNSGDPVSALVYAKIAQEMLDKCKESIAARPEKIVLLVQQLLDAFINKENERIKQRIKASKPSLASLSFIGRDLDKDPEQDSTELVSVALSLVSGILTTSDLTPSPETVSLLTALRSSLSQLQSLHESLPSSVIMTVTNVSALIDVLVSPSSSTPTTKGKRADPYASDRKAQSLALTYLTDSQTPIRTEGISLLDSLIAKASPVLDIPSTGILLLSLLQDEDEFVYLAAVKSLGLLASRHSRTVVRTLVEKYVDHEEDMGLDQRLRIGEALLKTVESLDKGLQVEAARAVGDGTITVAGRRGRRPKEFESRVKRVKEEEQRRKEAEQAWGGSVPNSEEMEGEDEANKKSEELEKEWEGNEGEEDVRIRTSALSVLGVTIEKHIKGMGSALVSTAVDLAIDILKLETTTEKAILRRAAIIIIMSLVRALDKADDDDQGLEFGFAGETLKDIVDVLGYIQMTETDSMVVGHIKEVVDDLKTWQFKSLSGMVAREDRNVRFRLEGKPLAGLSVDPEKSSRSRIEEIE